MRSEWSFVHQVSIYQPLLHSPGQRGLSSSSFTKSAHAERFFICHASTCGISLFTGPAHVELPSPACVNYFPAFGNAALCLALPLQLGASPYGRPDNVLILSAAVWGWSQERERLKRIESLRNAVRVRAKQTEAGLGDPS
ncbi:hypothetical protein NDU88_003497 [Pleurodeles waltl]|uniref:Uncharacterized protein n=1 Tax=Pleurodeles waltl TaxID=8319 RepID=A0AAV7LIR9_PLEWA|nr:hypothetical protein NDU88_003497 [Pleurodeles waltl]